MIYHAFTLPRSPLTQRFALYGYSEDIEHARALARHSRPLSWATTAVGAPLLLGNGSEPPQFVKFHEREIDRFGCVTYLERLCVKEANGFTPIKLRIRTAQGAVSSYILPANIADAHQSVADLSDGLPIFVDPRTHFIQSAWEIGPRPDFEVKRILNAVAHLLFAPPADTVLTHSIYPTIFARRTAVEDLQGLADAIHTAVRLTTSTGFDPDPREVAAELIRQEFGLPGLPPLSPFTIKHLDQPIDTRQARDKLGRAPDIDLSVPAPLPIQDPARTLFSPASFGRVAEILDTMAITDCDITYTVINNEAIAENGEAGSFQTDRYLALAGLKAVGYDAEVHQLGAVVAAAVSRPHDYSVRVRKTTNEEALIEVTTLHEPTLLSAVHLDLAMLSLCALSAADAKDLDFPNASRLVIRR